MDMENLRLWVVVVVVEEKNCFIELFESDEIHRLMKIKNIFTSYRL